VTETQGSQSKILVLLTLAKKGPGAPGPHLPICFFLSNISALRCFFHLFMAKLRS